MNCPHRYYFFVTLSPSSNEALSRNLLIPHSLVSNTDYQHRMDRPGKSRRHATKQPANIGPVARLALASTIQGGSLLPFNCSIRGNGHPSTEEILNIKVLSIAQLHLSENNNDNETCEEYDELKILYWKMQKMKPETVSHAPIVDSIEPRPPSLYMAKSGKASLSAMLTQGI